MEIDLTLLLIKAQSCLIFSPSQKTSFIWSEINLELVVIMTL
jgi:hypothetical protein